MTTRNRLRSVLESGDVAYGIQVATLSGAMIEVCGNIGVQFVWLDLEHKGASPYDGDALAGFARAAEVSGTDALVRLPTGDPHMIRKVLDSGIRNLIIPQVETAEEVRRAVKATRFSYDGDPGERGASFARANQWGGDSQDYAEGEDDTVCLGVMIENSKAIENIDEILSVPELGFARVGAGDLSVSVGDPVDKSHPEIQEQIEILEHKAHQHGVPLGRGFSNPTDIKEAVEKGYKMITIGRDISVARSVLGDRYEKIRDFC